MRHFFRHTIIIFIIAVFFIAAGCSASRTASEVLPMAPAPGAAPSFITQSKSSAYDANETASGEEGSVDDRKIVRTGSLNMEVADISTALDEIAKIAAQYNGYVVSSNQRGDDDNPSGHISVRVPFSNFNDVLQKLKTLATKVTYENTNSQDVTEQYMDLKAQLKNYEATEAQYLELLKKAESVKDVLEVQKELSNVRGSIERTKGRIQYLERTTDMSLLEVQLQKAKPIGQSTWDLGGIFKSAVDGLIVFAKVLLGVLIWVLVFAPLWIIILVIIWAVRRKKKNKARVESSK